MNKKIKNITKEAHIAERILFRPIQDQNIWRIMIHIEQFSHRKQHNNFIRNNRYSKRQTVSYGLQQQHTFPVPGGP